ncbi:MAG: tRNA (adenosine(37)-N6)-threonylcarbamoyltransferase complex ATPase subunit type 1 TsaE [Candidatus Eremiobacteraeota bacterium]|nr:tRNA (adenosine(37)-N6)-threonylcarbamoyltransferase complex ATPase subunit type 1 TsaE [Candidatus Eremiobacteraeota bacterium]
MLALAAAFAPHLRGGDVIALEGSLGSGKTTFVRGLAAALIGGDPATSPTFLFRHRYAAANGPALEHLDLFRLEGPGELAELGLEEAFEPGAIVAVEWPDRAPALVGRPTWTVHIEGSGEAPRAVTLMRAREAGG